MNTVLGAQCGCGRRIIIACPTVADIPVVRAAMAGWGYDARGFVRCPDCLGGAALPAGPVAGQGGEQLSLLGGAV